MKETGIIMSGNQPKLVLDGSKTMARRVITSHNCTINGDPATRYDWSKLEWDATGGYDFSGFDDITKALAPQPWSDGKAKEYYEYLHVPYTWLETGQIFRVRPKWAVGGRLWVRETWAADKCFNHLKPSEIPDTAKIYYIEKSIRKAGGYSLFGEIGRTRPSIFMPRWASRITLEITEVRVERVQEIWMRDAIAEGCSLDFDMAHFGNYTDPISKFKALWDSLNAKRGYGWDVNPWLWVLSFKKEPVTA